MFSLIITIISIALVAALALATLYFGGNAFNVGVAKSAATKFITQSQQLQGAAEVYKTDFGSYPATMNDMVSHGYLISVPTAQADSALPSEFRQASYLPSSSADGTAMLRTGYVAPALPAGTSAPWVMLVAEHPVFMMAPVSEAICRSLNQQSYGQAGILKSVHAALNSQCYGNDLNNLTIVSSSSGAELLIVAADPASAGALGTINTTPVPTDTANADWLVAPDAATATATAPSSSLIAVDTSGTPLASVTFPLSTIGVASDTITVQFKNSGTSTLDVLSATISAPYSIVSNKCASRTLASNEQCAVSINFTPTDSITYAGPGFVLDVVDAIGGHARVSLTGAGAVAGTGVLGIQVPLDGYVIEIGQTSTIHVTGNGFLGKSITATGIYAGYPLGVDVATLSDSVLAVTIHGEDAIDSSGALMATPFQVKFTEGLAPFNEVFVPVFPSYGASVGGSFVNFAYPTSLSAYQDNARFALSDGDAVYVNVVGPIPTGIQVVEYQDFANLTPNPIPFSIINNGSHASYIKVEMHGNCLPFAISSNTPSIFNFRGIDRLTFDVECGFNGNGDRVLVAHPGIPRATPDLSPTF